MGALVYPVVWLVQSVAVLAVLPHVHLWKTFTPVLVLARFDAHLFPASLSPLSEAFVVEPMPVVSSACLVATIASFCLLRRVPFLSALPALVAPPFCSCQNPFLQLSLFLSQPKIHLRRSKTKWFPNCHVTLPLLRIHDENH